MANCANISERDQLEKVWNKQTKNFLIFSRVVQWIRQGFYGLITSLTAEDKIKIWTASDRLGQTCWNAYDPISDRFLLRASESELRLWLEQRYNR